MSVSREERLADLTVDFVMPMLQGLALPAEFYLSALQEQLAANDEWREHLIGQAVEHAYRNQPFNGSAGNA
jgi:hypothetical protein